MIRVRRMILVPATATLLWTPLLLAQTYVEVTPGAAGVSASTNDGNVPANAVDGSLATRWSANGDGQWLQLDLGAPQTVGFVQVAFYVGNTRTSTFDIQASPNAATWSTALTATSSGTTTGLQTFDFPDVDARYIRYRGHGNSVNGWNSLAEVEVFAVAGATPPTPTPTPTRTPTPTPTPTSPGSARQGRRGTLYTPPTNTFFINPSGGDTVVTINDTSGSVASVQSAINSARAANPGAILVIRLQAGTTYTVNGAGLVLGTRQCLVATGATVQAGSSSVPATFLVQIASGASNVSVAGGTFDGRGADLDGIVAPAANRVNIDKVIVRDTGRDGIFLSGHGSTAFDNEMTVTRSEVSGSPVAGIRIEDATQALVLDNHVHDNGTGIRLATSARSSVVNNTCTSNTTGIEAGGNDNVIANNTCDGNGTGIEALGTNNVFASNALGGNTAVGIRSAGTGSTFVDTLFTAGNASRFASGGSADNVIAYKGTLSAAGQSYFYPPLVDDRHSAAIVNGRGRFDLTIGSATVASVQSQYNAARSAHPNDVIVLNLTGVYTVAAAPLELSSNTAVVLTGRFQVDGATSAPSILHAANQSNISLSGGIIDGGNRTGRRGLHFSGCRMVQIDAVTLRNFGPRLPRSGGSNVVHLAGGSTPYVMTRSTINNSSARGVWSQLSGAKAIYTDNTISNCNMDGIDLDSHTNAAVVKFNVLQNNVRAGIFIEEGARWNQGFANVATGSEGDRPDGGNGLWVWANASGPTEQNTYFCNRSENNKRNVQCGTFNQITTQSTENNFLFNNVLRNGTNGIVSPPNGTQNYYSQNIVTGNATNYGNLASAIFFNSSPVP